MTPGPLALLNLELTELLSFKHLSALSHYFVVLPSPSVRVAVGTNVGSWLGCELVPS